MSTYSIKDLEQLSGIKAHTLRIWEQRYAILAPQRTDTNIRTYDDQDLKLVLNIALLKDHGYKISEISKLSPQELYQEVVKISEKPLSFPDQIQALALAMIDLDEEQFEKVMLANTRQFGFENTYLNVIYPFLSRVGILWVTGSIGPAQEHFITSLIRQKLIVAIDGLISQPANGKKYMLFLPEGEYHEISLLFAHYIIRSRSNKVIYFGQSLPFRELAFAYDRYKPDYLFTVLTSSLANHEVQHFVNRLASTFPKAEVMLTGYQVVGQDIETPGNVSIITQINELIRIASS
ncbi:MerR family transcriptional regulator [Spirosoma aerolatum]|uniref:MerR family transcriptional regulator n=1 Tax=Spirosoma aerolatum TaxID=1211326 RepID=UPI0009ADE461|nr:MerR family transcriptional regulator [Spirosoma aerolatum]